MIDPDEIARQRRAEQPRRETRPSALLALSLLSASAGILGSGPFAPRSYAPALAPDEIERRRREAHEQRLAAIAKKLAKNHRRLRDFTDNARARMNRLGTEWFAAEWCHPIPDPAVRDNSANESI